MSGVTENNIGERLKSRREELGYSLKDAAERTRIRKSYIESLEAGRFSSLPGEAYVTGFIKVYAGYLGLDPAPLLSLLEDRPVEPASAPPVHENSQPTQSPPVAKPTSSGWAAFFVGFVAVLIMGGGLFFLLASDDAEMLTEETPVVEKDNIVTDVKDELVEKTPPAVEVDQQPATEEDGDVAIAKEESATPEPPLATIKKTGSSLRMLAVSNGSLIINVDQRKPQEYVLHDGLDLTWKVKDKVFFEMAAAGQARFWLDGIEIKLDGRESLQITHAP